jgi:hypothetical protein
VLITLLGFLAIIVTEGRLGLPHWFSEKAKAGSSPAPEAHTYNPNYSGGSDQEDCGSKPARRDGLQYLILKKNQHKNKPG